MKKISFFSPVITNQSCEKIFNQFESTQHYIGEKSFEELKSERLKMQTNPSAVFCSSLADTQTERKYGLASLKRKINEATGLSEYFINMHIVVVDKTSANINVSEISLDGNKTTKLENPDNILQKLQQKSETPTMRN